MKPSHVNKVTCWTNSGKWSNHCPIYKFHRFEPLILKNESVREQSTRGSWVYYGTIAQNPQDWEDRLPGDLCSRQVTDSKPAAPVSYDPWFSLWRWYDLCWINGENMQPAWAAQRVAKMRSTVHFVKMRCLRLLNSKQTKFKWTIRLASGTSSSRICHILEMIQVLVRASPNMTSRGDFGHETHI